MQSTTVYDVNVVDVQNCPASHSPPIAHVGATEPLEATSLLDRAPKLAILLADDNCMIRKLLERLFTYVDIRSQSITPDASGTAYYDTSRVETM